MMLNKNIHAVLFDFGGVIADEGFRDGLIQLAVEQGLDTEIIVHEGMQAVYDSGFVLGTGTGHDFWQLMRENTGLSGEYDILTKYCMDRFVVRDWMMDCVSQLHNEGYIVGILSDQTHWLDELDQIYHFMDRFDHIYNSYYMGKGKQDPSLFDDIAERLQISPSSILFVDDNEGHIQRARSRGWQAILYVDRDDFNQQLATILNE
ncbi:MAG: HAD family phosphatase [Gammaproteobacteria bacterium]|nr:HAD family phosphatase [Gammaproteobacteria bacterium]